MDVRPEMIGLNWCVYVTELPTSFFADFRYNLRLLRDAQH